MAKVTNRLVDELTAQQQARGTYDAAQRRRDAALRLPPLPSGHRDPDGRRTDAPARGYFVAGGEG